LSSERQQFSKDIPQGGQVVHIEGADMEPAVADEGRSTKMETQPPRSLGAT
jgi:hypothetical protein